MWASLLPISASFGLEDREQNSDRNKRVAIASFCAAHRNKSSLLHRGRKVLES
jgi:hypothetical protein